MHKREDHGKDLNSFIQITMTVVTIGPLFLLLLAFPSARLQEQTEHREFQYNSDVDPATGRYNFAYDTGNDNDIAHSMHMQYKDADGIVRGRYGYTDPNGKLRVVEYEAGPNGFVARGDVGPDGSPHDAAPAPANPDDDQPAMASYTENSGNDFELDPAPVQMAGWDPEVDPMRQAQPGGGPISVGSVVESENSIGNEYSVLDPGSQPTTSNGTAYNALELYGPELGFYTDRYPRVIYSPAEGNTASESATPSSNDNESEMQPQPTQRNEGLDIYNIDVDPDSIRVAARNSPVRRSADGDSNETQPAASPDLTSQETGNTYVRVPYSYRRYYDHRDIHDHNAEERSRHAHDHNAERRYYVVRQTHDHDAEKYKRRPTHNHAAEQYIRRQTHDHDAEKYKTHDHAAEKYKTHDHAAEKYKPHDHAAERAAYLRRASYYYGPRKIFYRDSHSMEPHEHYDNPVYRNYRDHQHSDVHLYGRYRNRIYPGVARSGQLTYIPSDKYHNKAYYWGHN